MLSVYTLSPPELGAALEALPPQGSTAPEPRLSGAGRRGALMLLLRILEQRTVSMAATGSVADDDALLADDKLPARRRGAVLYRRTQKQLAAQYLALVRDMLRSEGFASRA